MADAGTKQDHDRTPSAGSCQADNNLPKWPVGLVEIYDVTLACIQRTRTHEPPEMATAVVKSIAEYFGGRLFYIPKGEAIRIAVRNREIYNRMGRETASELAAEYKLGVISIYRIVREQRALRKKKASQQ